MNIEFTVLIVIVSWFVLALLVALAVGGMAKARDVGAAPLLDHSLAPGRMAPPARDERVRTAI
jgi:hypothetical protein